MQSEKPISQNISGYSGVLKNLYIRFATYGRVNNAQLYVRLLKDADIISEWNIDTSELTDNAYKKFALPYHYHMYADCSYILQIEEIYDEGNSIAVYLSAGENYTDSQEEREDLVSVGWNYEGIAWNAPEKSDTPVYRLYNPNAGDHHYTTSVEEKENLTAVGWNYEGIGWYSDDAQGVVLYRLYNPNAESGTHHYTMSVEERDGLVEVGWIYEGISWFGVL